MSAERVPIGSSDALPAEVAEQRVRDELMYAMTQHEHDVERQFIEWLADDFKAFAWAMLNPGERGHREIIENWRLKWVNEQLSENGWQSVNRLYGLGVE